MMFSDMLTISPQSFVLLDLADDLNKLLNANEKEADND